MHSELTKRNPTQPQYFNVGAPFEKWWTSECEESFCKIIRQLTQAPVLLYADPTLLYALHVDASYTRSGAVLYQEHEGKLRPVAFES